MNEKTQSIVLLAAAIGAIGVSLLASQRLIPLWGVLVAVVVIALVWGGAIVLTALQAGRPVGKIVVALVAMVGVGMIVGYLVLTWQERLGG